MSWETLPEWARVIIPAALGVIGTVTLGILQANSDRKRVRSDDRSVFTSQVLDRLSRVEQQMQEEREYYESRLAARDGIISELRASMTAKDVALQQALQRIAHLEQIVEGKVDDGSSDSRI